MAPPFPAPTTLGHFLGYEPLSLIKVTSFMDSPCSINGEFIQKLPSSNLKGKITFEINLFSGFFYWMRNPFKQRIWHEGVNSDVGDNQMIRVVDQRKCDLAIRNIKN